MTALLLLPLGPDKVRQHPPRRSRPNALLFYLISVRKSRAGVERKSAPGLPLIQQAGAADCFAVCISLFNQQSAMSNVQLAMTPDFAPHLHCREASIMPSPRRRRGTASAVDEVSKGANARQRQPLPKNQSDAALRSVVSRQMRSFLHEFLLQALLVRKSRIPLEASGFSSEVYPIW